MNNFKNFVITVLSIIVIVQSLFLFRLISRQGHPVSRAARPARVSERKAPPLKEKPAPAVRPRAEEKERPVAVVGKIAIVLDDWGYNLKNKDFVINNDFHVTLSILPFRAYSTEIAQMANTAHKDVIIHMPMEPHDKENYGLEQNTLLVSMDKKTVLRLLEAAFESVPYAKGMSNHMGSKATENFQLMKVVIEYLKKRGVFFLDSFVTPKTVCRQVAKSFGVTFFHRDVFIDNESAPEYIKAQMNQLAQKARRSGMAVGIGHDRPATIAVLKEVIPQLEKEGYRFVGLTEVTGETN